MKSERRIAAASEDEEMVPDALAICTEQLREIGRALDEYQRHHGELPPHLSDLYPQYVDDLALFHCPADSSPDDPSSPGDPLSPELADPKIPISYLYALKQERVPPHLGLWLVPESAVEIAWREAARMQRVYFGDRVPSVRCRHHQPMFVHLTLAGQVYCTRGPWEQDPTTVDGLLERMELDLAQDRARFPARWLTPEVESYFSSILDPPLPRPVRARLDAVADRLSAAAPPLPAASQVDAHRLAARLYRAAGQLRKASHAYKNTLRGASDAGIAVPHPEASAPTKSRKPRASVRAAYLGAYLEAEMARQHLPGLSIAVMREGKLVLAQGCGQAHVEWSAPATPETVYLLGSVTKTFTAAAIMLLVEEGKLGLQDRVTTILPDLPATWDNITVWHLLTHTCGIKDVHNAPTSPTEHTPEAWMRVVADLPLEFEPGDRWTYTNSGYLLLGLILETVSGKPCRDVLAERIFQPLGMTATGVLDPDRIVKNRAAGYLWKDETLWNGPVSRYHSRSLGAIAAGGGGMGSTVIDMAKWEAALCEEKLLRRSTLEQMWTPAKLRSGEQCRYGLGWWVQSIAGDRQRVWHAGRSHGFSTCLFRFVDEQVAVIVLCNLDQTGAPDAMAEEAAYLYLSLPM
jgi:D-alanyl-D-alanine carboxypeptidase